METVLGDPRGEVAEGTQPRGPLGPHSLAGPLGTRSPEAAAPATPQAVASCVTQRGACRALAVRSPGARRPGPGADPVSDEVSPAATRRQPRETPQDITTGSSSKR